MDSGSEFQTVDPKTERSFPKGIKRKARNCQQRGVKRAQRPTGTVWMKKVRNIRWHTVLKTETVLYRILTFSESQWSVLSSDVALACLDLLSMFKSCFSLA